MLPIKPFPSFSILTLNDFEQIFYLTVALWDFSIVYFIDSCHNWELEHHGLCSGVHKPIPEYSFAVSVCTSVTVHAMHRSRIRYLSEKNSRILTNFPKLKKFVKIRKKIL